MSFMSFMGDVFNSTGIGQIFNLFTGGGHGGMSPEMRQLASDMEAKNAEFMIQANDYINSTDTGSEGGDVSTQTFIAQAESYMNPSNTAIA
jgi:hypothetical protein